MAGAGLGCAFCILLALTAQVVLNVNIGSEKQIKKKKKLKEHQDYAQVFGALSFFFAAGGIGGYFAQSMLFIKPLKEKDYFPYPFIYSVAYAMVAMVVVQFIVAVCAFRRHFKY